MGSPGSRQAFRKPVGCCSSIIFVLLSACAGPAPEPLEAGALARDVSRRGDASPELLRAALDLYDAPPLGLRLPAELDTRGDAARDVFWHAHALAFEPTLRAARRRWRAAREQAAGAGQPGRTGLALRNQDLAEPDRENEVTATFDLLGLLGLGPRAAERDVADHATGLALGRLEEAVWRAVFAVDGARARLHAARRREEVLRDLATEARRDLRRLELLHERDRLGTGVLERARAVVAGLDAETSRLADAVARARASLARAAGLPPHAPALDAVVLPARGRDATTTETAPDAEALLANLPRLRSARLAYALAESRLRAVSAAWWPNVHIGPQLKIRPDDFLSGGILSLELPWPATVSATVAAALERRAGAREAVEDALAVSLARLQERRRTLLLALAHERRDVSPLSAGSAGAWRAARARLSVLEGLEVVETWLDALQLRTRGALAATDARERVLLADLDYREAAGLPPGLEAGAAP